MSGRATIVVLSGRALRERRKAKRLSTTELGAIVGRSAQTIWNYEHGNTSPDGATVVQLADALGCVVYGFFEVVAHEG